jgi:hypothetical protein
MTWLFGTVLLILWIAMPVVIAHMTKYRIDIDAKQHFGQGASRIWQVNVFRESNYSEKGKRWVTILQIMQAIAVVCILGLAISMQAK